jgi:hypothetical protein
MPRRGHVSAKTESEVRQVVVPAWFFAQVRFANVARMKPTGPARSGGPDDKLHEIREKFPVPVRSQSFAALHPGYEEKEKIGGETPTDATVVRRARRARPRLKREAHIYRRSTAALA